MLFFGPIFPKLLNLTVYLGNIDCLNRIGIYKSFQGINCVVLIDENLWVSEDLMKCSLKKIHHELTLPISIWTVYYFVQFTYK